METFPSTPSPSRPSHSLTPTSPSNHHHTSLSLSDLSPSLTCGQLSSLFLREFTSFLNVHEKEKEKENETFPIGNGQDHHHNNNNQNNYTNDRIFPDESILNVSGQSKKSSDGNGNPPRVSVNGNIPFVFPFDRTFEFPFFQFNRNHKINNKSQGNSIEIPPYHQHHRHSNGLPPSPSSSPSFPSLLSLLCGILHSLTKSFFWHSLHNRIQRSQISFNLLISFIHKTIHHLKESENNPLIFIDEKGKDKEGLSTLESQISHLFSTIQLDLKDILDCDAEYFSLSKEFRKLFLKEISILMEVTEGMKSRWKQRGEKEKRRNKGEKKENPNYPPHAHAHPHPHPIDISNDPFHVPVVKMKRKLDFESNETNENLNPKSQWKGNDQKGEKRKRFKDGDGDGEGNTDTDGISSSSPSLSPFPSPSSSSSSSSSPSSPSDVFDSFFNDPSVISAVRAAMEWTEQRNTNEPNGDGNGVHHIVFDDADDLFPPPLSHSSYSHRRPSVVPSALSSSLHSSSSSTVPRPFSAYPHVMTMTTGQSNASMRGSSSSSTTSSPFPSHSTQHQHSSSSSSSPLSVSHLTSLLSPSASPRPKSFVMEMSLPHHHTNSHSSPLPLLPHSRPLSAIPFHRPSPFPSHSLHIHHQQSQSHVMGPMYSSSPLPVSTLTLLEGIQGKKM